MTTQAYIDETTGEQLATVRRDPMGKEFRVWLSPRVLDLLGACRSRNEPPPTITSHVFYAHHFRDDGRTEVLGSVCFGSEAQCDAALSSLPRLIDAVTRLLDAS